MNLLEALTWGEAQIKETAHEKHEHLHNAKLDAQTLLAYVVEKPVSYVFAHFDQVLTDKQQDQFKNLIARRSMHEPVAYLIGRKEFFGRAFTVNAAVLIPRPETETLIEAVTSLATPDTTILDIGTGSGTIAVTLAAELGQPVVAIDLSDAAIDVAKQNATTHRVAHLLSFLHGDLLTPYLEKNITDSGHTIIAANLPYLPVSQSQAMDPDVTEYEPSLALYGGTLGLDLYEALLDQIARHRHQFNQLTLMMEIDPGQATVLSEHIRRRFPEPSISVRNDLTGKPRVLIASI